MCDKIQIYEQSIDKECRNRASFEKCKRQPKAYNQCIKHVPKKDYVSFSFPDPPECYPRKKCEPKCCPESLEQ